MTTSSLKAGAMTLTGIVKWLSESAPKSSPRA